MQTIQSILFAAILSLPLATPAFANDTENLLEEASARAACGPMRLVDKPAHTCVVAFFPDRVGAQARFACGDSVFACACTAKGPICVKEEN